MRVISTLLLLTALQFSTHSQSWKFITSYSLGLPQQEMKENIQPVHSLQMGLLYQIPKIKQLSVGAELGIGSYASKRIDQTFTFDNTTSVVPVNYNSNAFNANLQARFELVPGEPKVIPYINLKGGLYNFFSNIYIDDPEDPNGCKTLEHENIINDKTLYWSAGGGVQIDLAALSKRTKPHRFMIDLSASTVRGGAMDYINSKHLLDAAAATNAEGKPLNARFVNASTQSIHEHTIAQVYTTPLRILEFRLGMTFNLGGKN